MRRDYAQNIKKFMFKMGYELRNYQNAMLSFYKPVGLVEIVVIVSLRGNMVKATKCVNMKKPILSSNEKYWDIRTAWRKMLNDFTKIEEFIYNGGYKNDN